MLIKDRTSWVKDEAGAGSLVLAQRQHDTFSSLSYGRNQPIRHGRPVSIVLSKLD